MDETLQEERVGTHNSWNRWSSVQVCFCCCAPVCVCVNVNLNGTNKTWKKNQCWFQQQNPVSTGHYCLAYFFPFIFSKINIDTQHISRWIYQHNTNTAKTYLHSFHAHKYHWTSENLFRLFDVKYQNFQLKTTEIIEILIFGKDRSFFTTAHSVWTSTSSPIE